jgi:hypothetical protein
MPNTVGAKRRWAVLIMQKRSASVNVFGVETGSGVRGEGAAFEPTCPAQHWRDLPAEPGSYFLPVLAAAFFSHGLALHFDPVRVMDEPVEDAVGDGRITDLGMPAGDR